MVEIFDLALKAVIDSIEIYTINSLIEKAVFAVVPPQKQNTKKLLLLKEVLGHVNHFFNKISFFEYKPLFKIFTFPMIL